ncbi:hypothetical protein Bca101_086338 [Brassica carinata]
MEVASEGTNLMKKVHPDEHIVPSLDLLQNAVAFEFTSAPDHVCVSCSYHSSLNQAFSSLREDGAVLLNALKILLVYMQHYDDVRLSNLGMDDTNDPVETHQ